jgi:hypothetical protein
VTGDQTGIRDPDMVRHVEKTFLGPIRSALTAWMGDSLDMDGKQNFHWFQVVD